jgi:hypothetical protein
MNYETALNLIKTGRKGSNEKKLARNTYLIENHTGVFGVRLHNTIIANLFANGEVVLNSGGYQTKTTKDRINKYSGFYVQQKKGVWSVWQGQRFIGLFRDGMRLSHDGRILNK